MASFAEKWPVKTISMDLTEDCTCRCHYCFCGEKTRAVMEKDTAFRTIDWLLDKNTSGDISDLQVDLWGGEPLMQWPLARDVISYGNRRAEAMGKRIKWNMTTNGVPFTERVADDMLLAGVSFMLSLDGAKNTQDSNRPLAGGGSSYDVIIANLPNMRKVNPNLRARATIAEDDVGNMYSNFLHIHRDLGIEQYSHCLAHESAWTHESLQTLEEQLRLIAEYYIEQKKAGNERLWVKFIDDTVGKILYPRPLNFFCGAGKGYLSVSTEGAIYPCHRFHDFSDPRPWEEQFFAIGHIEKGVTNEKVRDIFLTSNTSLEFCRGCKMAQAGACTGSCYAVNYTKSGHDIAIPAHSQCAEMHMVYGITTRVYNELVHVPAFRRTLMYAAKERWRPLGCNMPSCDDERIDLRFMVTEGTQRELDVLESALASIYEAIQAVQDVLTAGISEREWRLSLLHELSKQEIQD